MKSYFGSHATIAIILIVLFAGIAFWGFTYQISGSDNFFGRNHIFIAIASVVLIALTCLVSIKVPE